ncbi:HNH endonuclease signature motif containing protein [Staphylococcus kloosii]|uniref:HNH endonuclease n=1 Tax=Staphylococcus kloosii TaxID=29384 RepID=A0A151A715_9STAP|nr:HNH endonuclease signature motif containing protein [Staphylococcus kloosii]KYH14900.1 HNH endonuclease [Staphylococcus kloosii]
MIPNKKLGKMRFNNRKNKEYCSLYECPNCKKEIIRPTGEGNRLTACSQSCAETIKIKRGRNLLLIGGYNYRYIPDHPKASKMGYVAEHRYVMENEIGRYLNENEVVHHINENKLDNNIENLQLMTRGEHSRFHAIERWRNKNGKFEV